MTATTSDSFGVLRKKYEKATGTVASLKASGAHVMHGVDATKLDDYDWNTRFNRIVFNFPHVGGSTPKDIVANQDLLLKFFQSSTPLLVNSKSEIHISLRTTPFYKSWDIKTIAEKAGYKLRKKIDFNEDLFIRYENKRTAGDDKFRAPRAPKGNRRRTCSGILACTTGPETNKAFVFISFSSSIYKRIIDKVKFDFYLFIHQGVRLFRIAYAFYFPRLPLYC